MPETRRVPLMVKTMTVEALGCRKISAVGQPSAEEALVLEAYFTRTALFWNYCVDALKEDLAAYIDSVDPDATERFRTKVYNFAKQTVDAYYGELAEGVNPVPESWAPYLSMMFELPIEVYDSRLLDYINACVSYKEKGAIAGTALPTRKNDLSTQLIRLPSQYFKLCSDHVEIRIPDHPVFDLDLKVELPVYSVLPKDVAGFNTLTITKQFPRFDPKFGPRREDGHAVYRLSVSAA